MESTFYEAKSTNNIYICVWVCVVYTYKMNDSNIKAITILLLCRKKRKKLVESNLNSRIIWFRYINAIIYRLNRLIYWNSEILMGMQNKKTKIINKMKSFFLICLVENSSFQYFVFFFVFLTFHKLVLWIEFKYLIQKL